MKEAQSQLVCWQVCSQELADKLNFHWCVFGLHLNSVIRSSFSCPHWDGDSSGILLYCPLNLGTIERSCLPPSDPIIIVGLTGTLTSTTRKTIKSFWSASCCHPRKAEWTVGHLVLTSLAKLSHSYLTPPPPAQDSGCHPRHHEVSNGAQPQHRQVNERSAAGPILNSLLKGLVLIDWRHWISLQCPWEL